MGGENILPCAECGENHYESDMKFKKTKGIEYELPYCNKCYAHQK